jgi:hypothetical protein
MIEDITLFLRSNFDRNKGFLSFKFYILKKSALLLLISKNALLLQISNPILIWASYELHMGYTKLRLTPYDDLEYCRAG